MKFIGITGGIGAGKSEILAYIGKHYKCEIYLADKVAFLVRKPGTACYDRLVELLGKEAADDPQVMAKKIYSDPKLLAAVNALIHPAVKEYLLESYNKAKENPEVELFFVEAALLIECGYKQIVDEMWYIYADEDTRIKRLMESRGYSREKASSIISKQLSEEEFKKNCDVFIDNSGNLEETYLQIDAALEGYIWQK